MPFSCTSPQALNKGMSALVQRGEFEPTSLMNDLFSNLTGLAIPLGTPDRNPNPIVVLTLT